MKMSMFGSLCATVMLTLASAASGSLIIKGVVDGPIALDGNGGDPKTVVLQATADIPDLSVFGIDIASNGGGSTSGDQTLFDAISVFSGDLIVVSAASSHNDYLTATFPDIDAAITGPIFINGDDPFVIYEGTNVVDIYGDLNTDGSGEVWEYTDSYAVRVDGAAGAFDPMNYVFAGVDALDGLDEAGLAVALQPLLGPSVPEPASIALALLGVAAIGARRRNG